MKKTKRKRKIQPKAQYVPEPIQDFPAIEGPELPVPLTEETRLVQAEVSLELFQAVEKEIERRKVNEKKIKIKQVLEFGLQCFLLRANKEEAERLGVKIVSLP
jgi:hypothetical protein